MILDYLRLPRDGNSHGAYEIVISTLVEAIGAYEVSFGRAKRDLWSPVYWLARLIRAPITIMERAGFGDAVISASYARFLKVAMAVIVVLIAIFSA